MTPLSPGSSLRNGVEVRVKLVGDVVQELYVHDEVYPGRIVYLQSACYEEILQLPSWALGS